ncbi:hypothetical protein [Rhodovulum sp. MB263]|uniref:hypothetical protein n=1 Tax=Rhodovulum sp. (strain MB263) TaxID=308754 RepID=UPI0009B7D694|nr:hypothetical protein [Rhodovulum sp. MB263]ARC89795.1 hypothetical protein B5V46_14880 [Rhodovulum sp. MB263]
MTAGVPITKTCFAEARIMGLLHQVESSGPAADQCREDGMPGAMLCMCRAKDGMDASLTAR